MKIKTHVKGIVDDKNTEINIPSNEYFTSLSNHSGHAAINIKVKDIPKNVKEIRFFCAV